MTYTPSIDEFCDGFEYEVKIGSKWKKQVFKNDSDIDILETRVNYLSEQDIVDLGFRFNRKDSDKTVYVKELASVFDIGYIELFFTKINDEPFITMYRENGFPLLYDLNIRNKHELKWILTRYGLV